jgi:Arc/MetJ-type ribon-helix-helix transcriptional regulator
MSTKGRLSASVDADLIEAAANAVADGRSVSVSAWVNEALRLKLARDRRLAALSTFIAAYERDHGEITADELQQAARRARTRAVPVRGRPAGRSLARTRRRRTE